MAHKTSVIGDPGASLLLTDLYQLTMLQSYFEHGMTGTAVFELFFRTLPARRGSPIAATPAAARSAPSATGLPTLENEESGEW